MKRLLLLLALLLALPAAAQRSLGVFQDSVFDVAGRPVAGATITVNLANTSTAAVIFSTPGAAQLDNPTTSDAQGNFIFYAEPGTYDVVVSGTGITTTTIQDIGIFANRSFLFTGVTAEPTNCSTGTLYFDTALGIVSICGSIFYDAGKIQAAGAAQAGVVTAGNQTFGDGSTVKTTGIWNGATGFRINGAAVTASFFVGDGTNYIASAALADCDNATADKVLFDLGTLKFTCGSDQTTPPGGGIVTLNGLSGATQTFSVTTVGTDTAWNSTGTNHELRIPVASGTNTGKLASADWTTFNNKVATSRAINTNLPLTGGGDLSANRTLDIQQASSTLEGSVTVANQQFGTSGTVKTSGVWEALVGFRINGGTTVGRYMRSNGTNYVQAAIAAGGAGVCGVNQFVTGTVDNAVPNCAQPNFSNLSGSASLAQLPFGTAQQFLNTNPGGTAIRHVTLVVGTFGADFNIGEGVGTVVFNLPSASATARGVVTTAAQTFAGTKTTPVWNASTGFQIAGAAVLGNVLRGNGTNFVSAVLPVADTSGTLAVARGGTSLTTATDDNTMVGNGATWQSKAIPDCSGLDNALNYDTATNAFSCQTISGGLGYALQGSVSLNSILPDSLTRYWGSLQGVPSLNADFSRIYVPKAGNITLFRVYVQVDGTQGSSEIVNHWLRLNDTTDNLNVQTAYNTSRNTGVATGSVAVVEGDTLVVKMTFPAWVTNPSNVHWAAVIFIE